MLHDLRYALRMLLKSPGFAAVAVFTLALGMGANTAIFSVVHAVLLRPLPYPAAGQLMRVFITENRRGTFPASLDDYRSWRDQSHAFASLAAYDYGTSYNLTGNGDPERLLGNRVTPSFFSVFGVRPALGRTFAPEDDRPGAAPVAVLSHALWRNRFNSDLKIVGRTLTLNDTVCTIVGVMPEGFRVPAAAQLWTPLDLTTSDQGGRWLAVVGRLRPGATLAQAQAEMDTIAAHPPGGQVANRNTGVVLISLYESTVAGIRPVLWGLLAAVGLVLLVACLNVANLLLARATARAREMAIRTALGAARRQIIRQLLVESILLSFLGGLGALLLALWGIDALLSLQPANIPRLGEVRLDLPVLGFALGTSLLSGILFGLVPAIQVSGVPLNESLKEAAHSSLGDRSSRMRGALVVAEIALTLVLVTGAGLMLRSLVNALAVEPGFDTHGVVSAELSLPPARYDEIRTAGFYQRLLEHLQAQPGVVAASLTNFGMPMDPGPGSAHFRAEGCPYKAPDGPLATMRRVMPNYFRALGVPLLRGRDFTSQDFTSDQSVLIINQSLARLCWSDQDPVGHTLEFSGSRYQVIGVVGDMHEYAIDWAPSPGVYFPGMSSTSTVIVRTTSVSGGGAGIIRREVHALDRNLPVYGIKAADQILVAGVASFRFNALLLGLLSGLVLLLTAVGVYGVVAYGVSRRTREIGIRIALGAGAAEVRRMVLRQGLWLALAGVAVGVGGALALTRLMESMLFGVSATDPFTFIAVAVGLIVVALLASYVPARRATKVDPMVALRYE